MPEITDLLHIVSMSGIDPHNVVDVSGPRSLKPDEYYFNGMILSDAAGSRYVCLEFLLQGPSVS